MHRWLGNFFASLFSSDFYNWAAHERRGVGLSYLLGIAFAIVTVGTIYCSYNFGADWSALVVVENKMLPVALRIYFSVIVPNELLIMLVLPIICWLLLTLAMFNVAVISSATIGQAMNHLYNEPLEFDQILRVNCYVVVAAMAISAVFVALIPSAIDLWPYIGLGLVILYNFYGVMLPKFDL